MYAYSSKLPIQFDAVKPDPIFFHILHERVGTYRGLAQIMDLMKCSFLIRDAHVRDTFSMIAAREMTNMEVMGKLMQLLLGLDASYVDCIDLNNPIYEVVNQASCYPQKHEQQAQAHELPDDLTAMIMTQQRVDKELVEAYQELLAKTTDQATIAVLEWLIAGKETNFTQWKQLLDTTTYPIKHKDFGEGYLSEQSNELDAERYFDTPNPYFLNPDDFDPQDHQKESF